MARLNVWVPDELAARAREGGLNVSALTQDALRAELAKRATDRWLDGLKQSGASRVDSSEALSALDRARDEFGESDG
ncbi:type II toxin-antitoxin system CcdA family antitoxin [Actinomycetospora termitidis]|uniref:Type II toxin-antitoxin system CcdA family antitoxin n=1 Tax=Actinomycetospora termitidis TaxID=3053470 RepID=A0ABT7M3T1_9PSEU|nr:type II toxin-antitoxin system CcdA family antitoxin [Actinomycetospora sp. Odt1-22]MDL5154412.1 type II toxin-antitoxin system CcdA family antitoxin [Actinomycetospora sp. Odt1-22]